MKPEVIVAGRFFSKDINIKISQYSERKIDNDIERKIGVACSR